MDSVVSYTTQPLGTLTFFLRPVMSGRNCYEGEEFWCMKDLSGASTRTVGRGRWPWKDVWGQE